MLPTLQVPYLDRDANRMIAQLCKLTPKQLMLQDLVKHLPPLRLTGKRDTDRTGRLPVASHALLYQQQIRTRMCAGAGKTYTMEGTQEHPGINYRTVRELFRCIESERAGDATYAISASIVELYNEQVITASSSSLCSGLCSQMSDVSRMASMVPRVHAPAQPSVLGWSAVSQG